MSATVYVRVDGKFVEKALYLQMQAEKQAVKAEQRKRDEQRQRKGWAFFGRQRP